MIKSYKYAILPTDEQKRQLALYFGGARFVYNLGLEVKMTAWATARRNVSCIALSKQLTELKQTEAPWLRECSSQILQMSLRNLDNAYTKFFKGSGFPKFKSKHGRQSVQFPQKTKVDFANGMVRVPKLGNVKCVFHRLFSGTIKTLTVEKTTTNKYFVSILVDNQEELPKKKVVKEESATGVDLGIKAFATLSDGTSFDNPKYLRSNLKRLRVEKRKMARRFKRGAKEQSRGYQNQKLVVAKLYERIRNQRKDYLQKTSTRIIRLFDTVCLENLNVNGMMQNSRLALAIGEVGWHEFKTMLEYKAEWYGKNILYIGRFEPSSKLCSNCGHLFKEQTLADRTWTCASCGSTHDRDVNAAQNIKTFGLRNKPSTANVSR